MYIVNVNYVCIKYYTEKKPSEIRRSIKVSRQFFIIGKFINIFHEIYKKEIIWYQLDARKEFNVKEGKYRIIYKSKIMQPLAWT